MRRLNEKSLGGEILHKTKGRRNTSEIQDMLKTWTASKTGSHPRRGGCGATSIKVKMSGDSEESPLL